MPTYEYQCKACSHKFEQFQLITAEPIKVCPLCKGSVQRLIGKGAGIIFKGSGFYQTDYRSPSYLKKAEADKKKPETEKKSESSKTTNSSSSTTSSSSSQSTSAK